ncbi:hypothetical protein tinsulaeT_13080 [Thalassotalea insulae]|uniref:DUF2726 domain-containing protein n=1 Tax=Thalassotalea insulae TaxID=2056778 RepID=A0ABQ6GPQ9_9GAMM|nr:DUF2726 domain-containing protein [Thalassotalea insulae]GLX77968.1 hypothetical protein tinsulaeT_13080 [Thalassotalea insulae]
MELILFAMISLIVIVALLASRLNDNSFPFPFDKKTTVFTAAEKNFQNLLEQAIGTEYRIINRVKLSDIVTIRSGVSTRATQTAVGNADNKYLDFVICEKSTMKLLGAIDLVDTQGRGYKVKKDWFVSGAMEAAAIPHLRIKVKSNYTLEEIRACIKNRILGNTKPEPKIKGRIIPAPLVKARTKAAKPEAGVITSAAAKALPNNGVSAHTAMPRQLPQTHALPH